MAPGVGSSLRVVVRGRACNGRCRRVGQVDGGAPLTPHGCIWECFVDPVYQKSQRNSERFDGEQWSRCPGILVLKYEQGLLVV